MDLGAVDGAGEEFLERQRAVAAVENAGATLGPVRLIDSTSRACQTDVLAGWPSYGGSDDQQTSLDQVVVTGRARMEMAAPPAPPPPPAGGAAPSEAAIEAARLALQPPLQTLTDSACVVYGLN